MDMPTEAPEPKHFEMTLIELPPEILLRVVSFLYVSDRCVLMSVDRTFTDLVPRDFSWHKILRPITASDECADEIRAVRHRADHMALVCALSLLICEECLKFSGFGPHPSKAVLPLPVWDGSQSKIISMCVDCRCHHFEVSPEPDIDTERIKGRLRVSMLHSMYPGSRHYFAASPLFPHKTLPMVEVHRRMRMVHGGDCGILASRLSAEVPVNLTKGKLARLAHQEQDHDGNEDEHESDQDVDDETENGENVNEE
ncbi:hypothetical protein BGZ83_002120 [Gryganskiella cystojenkinii]|nr:hypothetical protein BGZ83_002120 [Gryganskiella cystojenkinii]